MAVDRGDALEAILQRLCLVVEQVKCCAIVSVDGLPIAGHGANEDGSGVDCAELAALAALLAGAGQRALTRLEQGKRGRLVLEGEAGTMLSLPLGDVSLAILVESQANLAQVLFAGQKALEEVEAALAPA